MNIRKKIIITLIFLISLLLTGALLITPITNAISQNDVVKDVKPIKVEQATKDNENNTTQAEEETTLVEVEDKTGMSKSEAEAILNKYIKEVEEADFTYTYQGDENTFEAIKEKGIRGYVFLPNVDTDLAYLVDKDSGNIYYFHPSGYFEKLQ